MSTKSLLKFKNSRFLTENIWPTRKITQKQKGILLKLRKKKLSTFGTQFFAKRFLSILYGNLSYKDFFYSVKEARKLKGIIGFNFLIFLERRLDSILYRMNICQTFCQGKQLITHKKVFVNNKCVFIPSYQLKAGDILSISPNSKKNFSEIISRLTFLGFQDAPMGQAFSVRSRVTGFRSSPTNPFKGSERDTKQASSFEPKFKETGGFQIHGAEFQSISESKGFSPRILKFCKTKALHLELNLKTLSCILLYSPQQILFPSKFEIPRI
jgi:small subunit ribosomal protein S4